MAKQRQYQEIPHIKMLMRGIDSLQEKDSRLVISQPPPEEDLLGMHTHTMFEFRFLFSSVVHRYSSGEKLEELRLTPAKTPHPTLNPQRIPEHYTIRVDQQGFYYLRGRDCSLSMFWDERELGQRGVDIPRILAGFEAFCQGKWTDLTHFSLLIKLLLSAIVHLLTCRSTVVQPLAPVDLMARYIEDHYFRPDLTIGEIAQVCHLSSNYIQQIFQKKYQCTPIQYLNRVRLQHAKELLQKKTYRIKEVAVLCGWNYVAYFTRKYREHFGHLPSGEGPPRETTKKTKCHL